MRYDEPPTLSNWLADSQQSPGVKALMAKFQPMNVVQPPLAPRPPGLIAIDNLVGLYNKAFNPMSKRNVLFDLKSELDRTYPVHAPASEAVKALKEVVNRKLSDMPGAGRYTQVVCAAWDIGCNYDKKTGVTSPFNPMSNVPVNPDYFRHSADDQVDMERKCAEMFAAISAAAAAISTAANVALRNSATNAKTLKIFMAPEFFFRGVNGAYAPEIVSQIIPKLKSLGARPPVYEDWLFVFGTAVAAIEVENTYCQTCNSFDAVQFLKDPMNPAKTVPICKNDRTHPIGTWRFGAEVQNIALVQKGGENALVAKEYISSIDFLGQGQGKVRIHPGTPDSRLVDTIVPSGSTDPQWGANPDGFVSQNDERLGGCRLTIDGLRIALEVCLDHHDQVHRAQPLQGTTQILLVPSYGMEIGTGLYCVTDGVVFNVDGRGTGSSEVVVKGKIPPVTRAIATAVQGGRGTIDVWGPYPIPP